MTVDPTINDPRQRRVILLAVSLALLAVISSVSGLNVAQPQLARDLGASQSDVLWMINLYTITLAALLLPLGAAGDRWGRKPVLITGLVAFGAASVVAGFSPSTEVMLAARLLSGVGAAMIMPVTLAVITTTFPPEERSKAIGVWTAVSGAGSILGMFVSALLVDVASWRWLFLLPVVLVLVALPLVLWAIPNFRVPSRHPFDLVGALASMIAMFAFIFALTEGPQQGWSAPVTLVGLVVGVAGAFGFVVWERRYRAPLLDVRLFRHLGLASGSVSLIAVFGVPTGILVVLYLFLQVVVGWSGLVSTLALMPMLVLMILCSVLAPRLEARIGTRLTMAVGLLLCVAGLALMAALVSADGGYLSILPGYVVLGLGMGLSMTPSTEAITSSLPREEQGVASALNDIAREFGSALGVALLGAVLAVGYSNAINLHLDGVPPNAADAARKGIASVLAIAGDAQPYSKTLFRSAQQAFVGGWQQAMGTGAVVMVLVFVYVLVRGPSSTNAHPSGGK